MNHLRQYTLKQLLRLRDRWNNVDLRHDKTGERLKRQATGMPYNPYHRDYGHIIDV